MNPFEIFLIIALLAIYFILNSIRKILSDWYRDWIRENIKKN